MKKYLIVLLFIIPSILNAQKKVYLKNGLILNASSVIVNDFTTKSLINNNFIEFSTDQLLAIKEDSGTKFYAGAYARRNRAAMPKFFDLSKRFSLGINIDLFSVVEPGLQYQVAYLFGKYKVNEFRFSYINYEVFNYDYDFSEDKKTGFSLGYSRYTSLERKLRFYYGININYGDVVIESQTIEFDRLEENANYIGSNIQIGLRRYLSKSISLNADLEYGFYETYNTIFSEFLSIYELKIGINYHFKI